MDLMWLAAGIGVVGLIFTFLLAQYVLRASEGSEKIREISAGIQEGAVAFLGREYRILAVFVVIVTVLLGIIPNLGWRVAFAFVFGAVSSGLAGFIGMSIRSDQIEELLLRRKKASTAVCGLPSGEGQ